MDWWECPADRGVVELIVAEQRHVAAEAGVEVSHQDVLVQHAARFVLEEIAGGETIGTHAAVGNRRVVGAGERSVDGHGLRMWRACVLVYVAATVVLRGNWRSTPMAVCIR